MGGFGTRRGNSFLSYSTVTSNRPVGFQRLGVVWEESLCGTPRLYPRNFFLGGQQTMEEPVVTPGQVRLGDGAHNWHSALCAVADRPLRYRASILCNRHYPPTFLRPWLDDPFALLLETDTDVFALTFLHDEPVRLLHVFVSQDPQLRGITIRVPSRNWWGGTTWDEILCNYQSIRDAAGELDLDWDSETTDRWFGGNDDPITLMPPAYLEYEQLFEAFHPQLQRKLCALLRKPLRVIHFFDVNPPPVEKHQRKPPRKRDSDTDLPPRTPRRGIPHRPPLLPPH